MKYRKKPVVIEAVHYRGIQDKDLLTEFLAGNARLLNTDVMGHMCIETLEGECRISNGDYIIKGVKGEFYPCKPDIFEMTYEPVDHVTNVGKKVALTVEEAKLVKKTLAIASYPCFDDCDTYFAFFKEMGKRIEEAEKKND